MMPDYRHGVVTALSCWLAALAAIWLQLDEPWWAVMSAWVIANTRTEAVWQKGFARIIGTFVGCGVGLAFSVLTIGSAALQTIGLFAFVVLGTYQRFRGNHEYAWILGTVSVFLIVSVALETPAQLEHAAYYRALEITCGVVAASVGPVFLRPLLGLPELNESAAPVAPAGRGTVEEILRVSLIGGVAVLVFLWLWYVFAIPSLAQGMITIVVLLNRDFGSSRGRAEQRIVGCLLGGVWGLLGISVVEDSFAVWTFLFVLGLAVFARLHLSTHRWSYVGTQGGIAIIMTMVSGGGPPKELAPLVDRLVGIAIGTVVLIVVGTIAQYLFAPRESPLAEASRISV